MSKTIKKLRDTVSILAVLPIFILSVACEQSSIPSGADDNLISDSSFLMNASSKKGATAQLAEVRRHTAHFHDFENAEAAGYVNVNEGECVEHPELGGMGYHFVNFGLVGNQEELDITRPQAIMYEPQKNGRLQLIGVEYITEPGQPDIDPPLLFGEEFHWNPNLGFWALHVWTWRNNPSGMFADWNPKVSCDYQF